jgi:hypothetical protein
MKLNSFFYLSTLLVISSATYGRDSGKDSFTVSPIVGVERVQKLLPAPHMKTRTIFGANVLFKLPIASAEAEYTHGQDTTSDPTAQTSFEDVSDKVKLGLRGEMTLGSFLSFHLRGGAQGSQNQITSSINGAIIKTEKSNKVNPYAGTGLSIHLLQSFSLNADIVAVYKPTSAEGLSDYEISPSVGLSFNF